MSDPGFDPADLPPYAPPTGPRMQGPEPMGGESSTSGTSTSGTSAPRRQRLGGDGGQRHGKVVLAASLVGLGAGFIGALAVGVSRSGGTDGSTRTATPAAAQARSGAQTASGARATGAASGAQAQAQTQAPAQGQAGFGGRHRGFDRAPFTGTVGAGGTVGAAPTGAPSSSSHGS